MRKGKNSRLRIYSPTRTAVKTTSVVPTFWELYSPRNDPQPWNDPQIDPEMIPISLHVDPEMIPN